MNIYVKIGIIMLFLCSGCNFPQREGDKSKEIELDSFTFSYNLEQPEAVWQLPAELREISGLAFSGDSTLAAVQDEDAKIYLLSSSSGKLLNVYTFGKKGDYEGITMVGSTAWAVKSNGELFRVEQFSEARPVVTKYTTPLSAANNMEGLVYDRETNSLLLACKGKPGLKNGEKYEGFKAIYSFGLDELKLNTTPKYLIDLSVIEAFRSQGAIREFYIKATKKTGLISDALFFEPSGIAIHPQTNHLYIISHTAKLLLVLNREAVIVHIQKLNPSLFNQPEGICFSPDGTLFISNEGGKGQGSILKFGAL
jgi:uncharacterized protein YjiK